MSSSHRQPMSSKVRRSSCRSNAPQAPSSSGTSVDRSNDGIEGSVSSSFPEFSPIPVNLSKEKVMKCLRAHVTYASPLDQESSLTANQAQFDDLKYYGVKEEDAERMWQKEVDWLVQVANEPDKALGYDSEKLGNVRKAGWQMLSHAAELLDWSLTICRHDSDLLAIESKMSIANTSRLEALNRSLNRTLEQDQQFFKFSDLETCCALTDYVCATLVRVLTQFARSEICQTRCVAIIAKLATKIKYLCRDPMGYAKISVNHVRDLMALEDYKMIFQGVPMAIGLQGYSGFSSWLQPESEGLERHESGGGVLNKKQPNGNLSQLFQSHEDPNTAVYALEMLGVRAAIYPAISIAFRNLQAKKTSGYSVNALEASTLAYGLGAGDVTIVLGQDRDGDIQATSSATVVRRCHISFRHLVEVARNMKMQSDPPSDDQDRQSQVTSHWELEENGRFYTSQVNVRTMKDAVTLMVPLAFTNPGLVVHLTQLVELFNVIVAVKDQFEEPPPVHFEALFFLRTNAYEAEVVGALSEDVRPVSKCLMARQRLFSTRQGIDISTDRWDTIPIQQRALSTKAAIERFRDLSARINDSRWTIDDTCIVVKCRKYVYIIGAIAFMLVTGGLAIGLSVEQRIRGVDPFNITSFAWILAAFVIVIAKSIRVENWPWRDFLLCRVVCRSISELHSVDTKINDQDVIAFLLYNEASIRLWTRGPYNKPFRRRSGDGFSIDVKPELRTLFLGGYIIIKVLSEKGTALICSPLLDVERDVISIFHQMSSDENDLVSLDSGSQVEGEDAILKWAKLRWNRTLGIYHVPQRKFR